METIKHPAFTWILENKYAVLIVVCLLTALYYASRAHLRRIGKRLSKRIRKFLFTYGIWFPKYIGSVRPPNGTKMYEYNKATGVVQLAKFQEKRGAKGGRVVITKRKHLYQLAINEKNAYRKFAQILMREKLIRTFTKSKK